MNQAVMEPEPAITSPDEVFVLPASIGQKRFWMLEQMSPGDTALSIPIAFELSGSLEAGILERALQGMVDRHESLRTRLELIDGEPRQVISSGARLRLEIMEAPPASLGRDERIRRAMDIEARRPIDFTRAPLLRAVLVELEPEDHVLMITQHHAISDGWSNGLVIRELAAFYDAIRRDTPVALPPLSIQYADFVLWQQEWLKTPDFQQQLAYWRGQLAGEVAPLDFPTDFPRRSLQASGAILESRLLPDAVTEALRRLGQEHGVTFFMIFLTAYAALLHRYTGQSRILVGTTAANRNRPELEPIIGLFANLLVVPADIGEGMTFRELLAVQRDRALGGFANHEAPFELIVQELQQAGPARVPMHTHLLFQRAFMQPAAAGDLAFRPLRSVSPGSTLEFTFGIVERASEGIRLQMEYRPSLYRAETVQRMLLHFEQLLEAAAIHPETPIKELPLFAENEREEIEARLASALGGSGTADRDAIFRDLDRQLETHWLNGKETFSPIMLPGHIALAATDERGHVAPLDLFGRLEMALPGAASPEATPFVGRNNEGGVEVWGRAADLIRAGGFRVNRRALEIHLQAHPEVAEAAVSMSTRLVAQVVLREGAVVSGANLREWLRERVGDLFLPASIVVVPEIHAADGATVDLDEGVKTVAPMGLEAVVQQQLLEIWQSLLKTDDLTADSNFFDSGGNSFLALRMMAEAEKLVHQPLPLSLLLRGATVRELGRHILEGANTQGSEVIPVQTAGSQPPLFYLHGDWIGGGFYCNRLARDLGGDQPFYALPPFHMGEEKIVSMAEMAAHHVAAIRSERPRGPYLLGGYCIGAPVAIEVARRLVAEGETVEHLFLVDPPLWGGLFLAGLWPWIDRYGARKGWSLERRITFFDRTAVAGSRWWRKPAHAKVATVLNRLGVKSATRPQTTAEIAADDGLGGEEILESLDFSTYYMTYRLHRRTPLAVPATLFFPRSTPEARVAEAPGLTRLDPARLAVTLVPGNHTTCITEHIAGLAEKMREARDR